MRRRCVVLGGGGHAKVVIDTLRSGKTYTPVAVTDVKRGGKVAGIPVVGDDGVLADLLRKGIRYFIVGVGGVPDNRPRADLFERGTAAGLRPATAIHASAAVSRDAVIGAGTVVFPRAVVNIGAQVGRNVIVNSAALVEHDVRIGDHVHVCPGAILCGGVEVETGAFIGAGAVVKQHVRIGARAVVGAGAVVLRDVPPDLCVIGVPAVAVNKIRRDRSS
jgi:UDP-perosamine 4-acetyltransferase